MTEAPPLPPTGGESAGRVVSLCHILDSLGPGGTQRFLTYLVRGLAGRGYRQWVVSLNDHVDREIMADLQASAEVVVISPRSLLLGRGLFRIVSLLRRRRVEIVQTYLRYGDTVGRITGKWAGAPLIVSSIRARNIDKPAWQFWIDRFTTRWAHAVIFNSRKVIDFSVAHEGVSREKVVYIPNGVEIPPVPVAPREDLLRSIDLDQETRLIVSVGRLAPQKGHDDLMKAFAMVAGRFPKSHLAVLGEGPDLPGLRKLIGELRLTRRVSVLGLRQDVPAWLAAAEIFALASRYEGMSNALMEAMAAGLPVVVTRVDGNEDLVEHGADGLLVTPGRPDELAEALARLLADPGYGRRLGAAAKRLMADAYSVDKMVRAYDAVYRQAMASRQLAARRGGGD